MSVHDEKADRARRLFVPVPMSDIERNSVDPDYFESRPTLSAAELDLVARAIDSHSNEDAPFPIDVLLMVKFLAAARRTEAAECENALLKIALELLTKTLAEKE